MNSVFFIAKSLQIHCVPKKEDVKLMAATLSILNWFSKLFHWPTQQWICSKEITKDPTTPQMHCYTTLWNTSVRKQATIWNKCCD